MMSVKVHSLGAVDSSPANLILRDANGKILATTKIPILKAPTDLVPKTAVVTLRVPANEVFAGGAVTIESTGNVPETTLMNNTVNLPPVSAVALSNSLARR